MKKYLAEGLGTFLLVFIGTASVVIGGMGTALPLAQGFIGLAFGIGLIAGTYAIGPISGAHLNPAVTVGVYLAGRMTVDEVPGYIVAQIIGAIIASLFLVIICSGSTVPVTSFAPTGWDPADWSTLSVFLAELIATFVFVIVILGVTAEKHMTGFAGLVIGLTFASLHFAFIPVSGSSLNPARSIGPALFSDGAMGQLWLYIVAPIIGGALAGMGARTRAFEKE